MSVHIARDSRYVVCQGCVSARLNAALLATSFAKGSHAFREGVATDVVSRNAVRQNGGWAARRILHFGLYRHILFVLLTIVAARAMAGSVTLAWDPPTAFSPSGYMVYYGPSVGNYPNRIDVGNATTHTISGLVVRATYHFAATDYNASHIESGFSNDVGAIVPFDARIAQVTASFTASTTSGVAPLALNFTNDSTGNITSYAWTFGDSTTSIAANPVHVYSATGLYTVSLTVTGPGGTDTQTRSNYVAVSAPAPGDLRFRAPGRDIGVFEDLRASDRRLTPLLHH